MNKFLIHYKINMSKDLIHERFVEYNKIIESAGEDLSEIEVIDFILNTKKRHDSNDIPIIMNVIKLRG